MKIWIKYLLGTVFGLILALFLPFNTEEGKNLLAFFTELSIRMGRYFLVPVIFFSMTVAVSKLRSKRKLIKTGFFAFVIGLGVTVLVVSIGITSALIINLPRIPISGENTSQIVSSQIAEHILMLFPYNGIEGLFNGIFLVPVFILAGFAGASFSSDPIRAKTAFSVFESLSRISYSILSFFIDLLSVGVIAISCTWFITFFDILSTGAYTGLIILLAVDTFIIICGLLPLLLRLFSKKSKPFKVLYACLSPIILSLFSGDANLALASSIRHGKDSLGIQRKMGASFLPFFSAFVRSGSGLVVAVSFIAVWRSYSSLDISLYDVLWIFIMSVTSSFFLSGSASGGAFIALTVLCSLYGRGFEAGYLLLRPVAFIICTFATVIDVVSSIFCTYFIAQKEKMTMEKNITHFI